MSDFIQVGTKKDFPDQRTTHIQIGDTDICLARTGDRFMAFDDKCTHAEARLSGCPVEGQLVTCPLHGAKFDVTTGEAQSLPATEPLTSHDVKVEGDVIFIRLKN